MIFAIIILAIICICAIAFIFILLYRQSALKADYAIASERIKQFERSAAQADVTANDLNARLNESERLLQQKSEALIKSEAEIKRLNLQLETEIKRRTDDRATLKEQQMELVRQTEANFKLMANDIMRQHSLTFREQNEHRLGELLGPLKEHIESFRKQVNECYNAEARERNTLAEKIKDLIQANNDISREARELATALKGNSKTQGDWGEMVLESILEHSGLREGEEFEVQKQRDESGQVVRDEAGRMLRPDVIINYPGGRKMVIDSKVSLTAFIDYVNCDDASEHDRLGKAHLASVMKHINELSEKNYQNYIGTQKLDFVMMFIPNESAYAAAMSIDPTLWQKAFDKRVIIVSPTQLISSLRVIKQLWTTEKQTANAIEIATRSGRLYDKFAAFVTDMEKIKKNLDAATGAYDSAINKLSTGKGNLVKSSQDLLKLGIKASKSISKDLTDRSELDTELIPDTTDN